ncbi:hypothetical protein [Desulfatirhabdium butyrativorans]|uniref:hypothetical protein n=1 Tax=Desulfatirhabdium butyrativorans TaxID=340467 RepID=UPI0003F7D057|nr:hypothetical protein [Desulfatirhabdium butyrativorans]
MRTLLITMISVSILLSNAGWTHAAPDKTWIASLEKGDRFENDGFSYATLPTLFAIKTDASGAAALRADLSGNGSDRFIQQKGPFSLYEQAVSVKSASIRALSKASAGDGFAYPAVLNLKTQSLGVLTGKLWLKLKDLSDADAIASDYALSLSFTNTALSTAFYEVPKSASVNLLALRNQLAADPRVETVTLDMVDRIRHPM